MQSYQYFIIVICKAMTMSKMSLNFVFAGNPGTGKTTVAKLFADLLVDLGLRQPGAFIEKTGQTLLTEGPVDFKQTLKAVTPGVLFVDEVARSELIILSALSLK